MQLKVLTYAFIHSFKATNSYLLSLLWEVSNELSPQDVNDLKSLLKDELTSDVLESAEYGTDVFSAMHIEGSYKTII